MGMPSIDRRRWTADQVRRLNAETPGHWPRYELIDGELLVSPAPAVAHQRMVGWLFAELRAYVLREGLGEVLMAPADVELRPGNITQPDVFVVPRIVAERSRKWADVQSLLLAVEVLSPGTARHDRTVKRPEYQRAGVSENWIVDGDSRVVERWRPADERPDILVEQLPWHPGGAGEPLVLSLPELWSAARLDS